jgi:flavodoxin
MKKALLIYHSKTGVTRAFGKEISNYLSQNNVQTTFISINDFRDDDLMDVDFLLLGCWTSGLMIFFQHPEKVWINFSKRLPDLKGKKIGLFTTYKIATGSMFRGMKKHLRCNPGDIFIELKSRDGHLTDSQKTGLQSFI